MLKLRLATSDRIKRGEEWVDETEWHSVTMFGKRAEGVSKHLSKGAQILVEGHLHTSEYVDRNDEKRYSTEVIADDIEFGAGKRSDDDRPQSNGNASGGRGRQERR